MENTDDLQALNDDLKTEFDNIDNLLNLQYLADEYHATRSIHIACELADALYDYFNS